MEESAKQQAGFARRLEAFVSFPSPYTQSLLIQALVGTIPSISISLVQKEGEGEDPAVLQWADYDLLSFDKPHSCPQSGGYMISSYIYRKALIRKHQLHQTIMEYLSKCRHRNIKSILDNYPYAHHEGQGESDEQEDNGGRDGDEDEEGGGIPNGWVLDIQFADELDELLQDDLYDLSQALNDNQHKEEGDRQWFILKPGFADRAQGIRLFSTEDQLRDIFESFEPPSDDDDEYDDDDDDDDQDKDGEGEGAIQGGLGIEGAIDQLAKKAVQMGFNPSADPDDDDGEEGGTGVMTSQLRHFVIQEYLPRPVLFDIGQIPNEPLPPQASGHKFHLRAYVLITGGYTVHLSRTMLALFAGEPYTSPSVESLESGEEGLRAHLTNTCLQTDAFGAPTPPENLVKLFWELQGLSPLSYTSSSSSRSRSANNTSSDSGGYKEQGVITNEWLESVFVKVGKVISECVKAGEECGSFGLQFMPNAFEIFGVDLILSFPPPTSTSTPSEKGMATPVPIPRVTLLEFNASPDFHQSGDRLRSSLLDMFKGVVEISIKPFFSIYDDDDDDDDGDGGEGRVEEREEKEKEGEWEVGDERWGWTLVGKGKVRGSNW